MGRKAVDSNQLFIDGLPVPVEDRIGEEGKGFEYILHGMNPERILIAAEAVGLGRAASSAPARYAKDRVVFGRPIGQNQAHPASARARLDEPRSRQPDGVQGRDPSTTRASRAASKPTRPSTSPARPASKPARPRL